MEQIGRTLLLLGAFVILLGAALWGASRLGLGPLPGDIRLGGEGWSCYIPIATSLLLSVILTLLLNLLWRGSGK